MPKKPSKPGSVNKPSRDWVAGEGKKRGNPGIFQGPQLEYLQSYADEYCNIKGKNQMQEFWMRLLPNYFERFPWHLGEEPAEFSQIDATQSLPHDQSSSGQWILSLFFIFSPKSIPESIPEQALDKSTDTAISEDIQSASCNDDDGYESMVLDQTVEKRAVMLTKIHEEGKAVCPLLYISFTSNLYSLTPNFHIRLILTANQILVFSVQDQFKIEHE